MKGGREEEGSDDGWAHIVVNRKKDLPQSGQAVISSSVTTAARRPSVRPSVSVHLSLRRPSLFFLTKQLPRLGVLKAGRHTSGEGRKPGQEKTLKSEELCNAVRIHTELFGLPTYSHTGLGYEELRDWMREDVGRDKKSGIF